LPAQKTKKPESVGWMSGTDEKAHIFVVPPFQTREVRAFPPKPSSPAAQNPAAEASPPRP
jgi:hypothetical protein